MWSGIRIASGNRIGILWATGARRDVRKPNLRPAANHQLSGSPEPGIWAGDLAGQPGLLRQRGDPPPLVHHPNAAAEVTSGQFVGSAQRTN